LFVSDWNPGCPKNILTGLGLAQSEGTLPTIALRDAFAFDMLARGEGIYERPKMLAATVDTIEKHDVQFVPAARDAAQSKMHNGFGIEERAKLAKTRDRKVAIFPGA
jgi:hypothetical protein